MDHIRAARAGVKPIRFLGTHPKIVQERLGHSTISVTLDTYSHVTPRLQEAAARFDEAFTNKYNETANETTG
jgi:integrase